MGHERDRWRDSAAAGEAPPQRAVAHLCVDVPRELSHAVGGRVEAVAHPRERQQRLSFYHVQLRVATRPLANRGTDLVAEGLENNFDNDRFMSRWRRWCRWLRGRRWGGRRPGLHLLVLLEDLVVLVRARMILLRACNVEEDVRKRPDGVGVAAHLRARAIRVTGRRMSEHTAGRAASDHHQVREADVVENRDVARRHARGPRRTRHSRAAGGAVGRTGCQAARQGGARQGDGASAVPAADAL